jgi:DNA-binding Lrp family transcriptional regulator
MTASNTQIGSKMPLSFVHPVHRATHRIGLYLDKLGEPGLTQGEAHILALLAHSGPAKVAELHRGLAHKRSTLTSILDRLAKRNLITREVGRTDRRTFPSCAERAMSKGSKWSLSRVRPRSRFRTRLRRAKEIRSISGKEKPQVTKRYRTRRLRVFVLQKYYVRLTAFIDSLTDCQVSRSTVCKVLDRINRIRGTYLRPGFICPRRIEQNP